MSKAEFQTQGRPGADRPGARRAARRISTSPMATGSDRSSTGAEYLARLALKARELSQGRASASQGQN